MKRILPLLLAAMLAITGCSTPASRTQPTSGKAREPVRRNPAAVVLASSEQVYPRVVWVVGLGGKVSTQTIPASGPVALSPDGERLLYLRLLEKGEGGTSLLAQIREHDLGGGGDTVVLDRVHAGAWGYDGDGRIVVLTASTDPGIARLRPPLHDVVVWRGESGSALESSSVEASVAPDGPRLTVEHFVSADTTSAWFVGSDTQGYGAPSTQTLWRLDFATRKLAAELTVTRHDPPLGIITDRVNEQYDTFTRYGKPPLPAVLSGTALPQLVMGFRSEKGPSTLAVGPVLEGVRLIRLSDAAAFRSVTLTPSPVFGEDRDVVFDDRFEWYLETVQATDWGLVVGKPLPGGPNSPRPKRIAEAPVAGGTPLVEETRADYAAKPLGYVDDGGSYVYRATAEGTVGVFLYARPGGRGGRALASKKLLTLPKVPGRPLRDDEPVFLGVRYAK